MQGIGAGFGRAERGNARLRQQRKRLVGLGRHEHGQRLRAALRGDDGLDRMSGMELRGRTDHRQHRVAAGSSAAYQSITARLA